MKIRHLIALLAAFMLAGSACSSDDGDETTAESDSATEADGNGSDGGSDVDTSVEVDPEDIDAGEEAFDSVVPEECQFLYDLSVSVGLAATGQVDADEYSVDDAPSEVRDDVQVMIDAFSAYDPADVSSAQVFGSDEFEEATNNIEAFVDTNCDPDTFG
jgi:hypothetical protein